VNPQDQERVPSQAPSTWYRSFHHLQQLLDAYAEQEPDDEPGKPSHALTAYLRTITVTDPAPVLAAAQARELVANGVLDSDDFIALELLPRPTGPNEHDFFGWLSTVAELCEQAADQLGGYPIAATAAQTGWERPRKPAGSGDRPIRFCTSCSPGTSARTSTRSFRPAWMPATRRSRPSPRSTRGRIRRTRPPSRERWANAPDWPQWTTTGPPSRPRSPRSATMPNYPNPRLSGCAA
jgi:hypothetical protein